MNIVQFSNGKANRLLNSVVIEHHVDGVYFGVIILNRHEEMFILVIEILLLEDILLHSLRKHRLEGKLLKLKLKS